MGNSEGKSAPHKGWDGGGQEWPHSLLPAPCQVAHWALVSEIPAPPAPGDILSPEGAAHSIRRGHQPRQNGARRATMVRGEPKEGVQAALIPGAQGQPRCPASCFSGGSRDAVGGPGYGPPIVTSPTALPDGTVS